MRHIFSSLSIKNPCEPAASILPIHLIIPYFRQKVNNFAREGCVKKRYGKVWKKSTRRAKKAQMEE